MNSGAEYYDLQVNGYAGVDFNGEGLTGEQMHAACGAMAADGVAGFLATIITDHVDVMCRRLNAIVEASRGSDLTRRMVVGIHIEGPFLNESPGYIGAHPASAARAADWDAMQRLLEAAGGMTRLVTLAPERDPGLNVTRRLAAMGITVAAGHSDATVEQLSAAIDAGLSMFTHLGNGCPMQMHRHDNIIQRALSMADRLDISFIADGAHVPWAALGNYLRLVPDDRIVIVSDAISAAGLGPGVRMLGHQEIRIGDDLVPRSPDGSHFIGSGCPMKRMAENLQTHLHIEASRIRQWMIHNPKRILRMI